MDDEPLQTKMVSIPHCSGIHLKEINENNLWFTCTFYMAAHGDKFDCWQSSNLLIKTKKALPKAQLLFSERDI